MDACPPISSILPNHRSFCDTKAQKVILFALTAITISGLVLVLTSNFKLIPSKYQFIGAGLMGTALYPISAGSAHGIYRKCANRSQKQHTAISPKKTIDVQGAIQLLEGNWKKKGTLQCDGNFVYVSLEQDKDIFNSIFTIFEKGISSLRYGYQPPGKNVGYHVTVVSPKENMDSDAREKMLSAAKKSQEISFEIIGYKKVPGNNEYVEHIHVIQLRSQQLEQFRRDHGLLPKQVVPAENGMETIEFHVTIGEEPRGFKKQTS